MVTQSLAARLVQDARDRLASIEPIRARKSTSAPLSSMQESIWFLEQLSPGTSAWNLRTVLSFDGTLDVDALAHAIHDLQARHESLRTRIQMRDGVLLQEIGERIDLRVHDLRALDANPRDVRITEVRSAQRRPFELENAPLWRVALVRVSDSESRLWVTIHHIISDGSSLDVLVRDLRELYAARLARRPAALPSLTIQFADYAVWERAQLETEAGRRRLQHWIARLKGITSVRLPGGSALGVDRMRPSGRAVCIFPASIGAALRTACAQEDATLFMGLVAAFKLLLARYGGSDDIAVGTPAANRYNRDARNVVGPFVNTMVLRTDLAGVSNFRDALHRVREVVIAGLAHQDIPVGQVARALRTAEGSTSSSLFNVMVVVQRATEESALVELPSSNVQAYTEHDLTLVVATFGDDTMRATLWYDADQFEHSMSEQMLRHLRRIMEQVAAAPGRSLEGIELLDPAERQRVLVDWNATARTYPTDVTVRDVFEAQVDRTPDAVAVQHEGQSLTYRALDARANQLAHHLRALGVGPDRLVALFVERSLAMVVAMLAVHKAGGAYVPLDPSYPEERLRFIQEDTACAVVLTQASLAPRLPREGGAVIVELDTAGDDIARGPSTRPGRLATARHLSHLIYTSGSTGRPKGVAIEHVSTVNLCYWARDAFTAEQRDGVLFATSICFDLSVFELFATLAWGGRVVLVENALALATLPATAEVRLVNTVPSVLAAVLKTTPLPASVRTICLAGEPLDDALVARCYAFPSVRDVYDLYGPSETTTYSTYVRREAGGRPTIGRPLANTQVYVLDARRQLVSPGVAGETYIGGAGVARGYFGRPELTEDKFVTNPFGEGRLYRTGDLVRWTTEGTLEYLGRLDHQVKIRGFRIELGEIEAAVRAHPAVGEVAVLARDDRPGDKRLVAYVVGHGALDTAELRTHLSRVLPEYMVPSAVVVLEALPLTPNGKLDRKALPPPDASALERGAYVAPRTEREQRLAEIWSMLLGIETVGVHDDFFALGGHSLLAIRLVFEIERRFGAKVPLRDVFVDSTLGGLAASVGQARAADSAVERPTLYASATRRTRVPAALRGVFKLNKLMSSDLFARHIWSVWIDGPLDVRPLERALAAMRARHALLRTRFFEEDELEMLEVLDPFDVEHVPLFEHADLSSLSGAEQERADAAFHRSASFRPLDLGGGEVMSVAITRSSATRHRLTVSLHNIVSDAEAMTVYVNELCELWRAFAAEPDRDPAAILPPVPLQYHHLADYLERMRASESGRAQRAFWQARLEGLEPLQLPIDVPREEVDARREANAGVVTFRSGSVARMLPKEDLTAIERIAERERASVMSTLVAAMAAYLSQRTAQRDLTFITRLSHRYLPDLERTLGFLVNPILLRVSTEGEPAFPELIVRTHTAITEAFDHAECDLLEIAPYRAFRFCLVYTREASGGDDGALQLPHGIIATRAPHPGASEGSQIGYDLLLWLKHRSDGIALQLAYNLELFLDATAEALLDGYVNHVAAACKGPDTPRA